MVTSYDGSFVAMKRFMTFCIALLLLTSTAFAGNGALKAKTGMYELGVDIG